MAEAVRVVVRFTEGKVLKGTTQDFLPNRPTFHLTRTDGGPMVEVQCKSLKAVFFVRTFKGDPLRTSVKGFLAAPAATALGKKIAVRFTDGELLCGYTLAYQSGREGFFMTPADPQSNNLRVYVVTASTAEVKAGPAADLLVQTYRKVRKQPQL
jgi:hypothetical protein